MAQSNGALTAGIPQPGVPFLDESGSVSRPWFYFLISLLARTGGNGGISSKILEEKIASLFVEQAFSDAPGPTPKFGFAMSALFSDGAPEASLAPPLLVAFTADADPAPALNPFLASLLVSDVA